MMHDRLGRTLCHTKLLKIPIVIGVKFQKAEFTAEGHDSVMNYVKNRDLVVSLSHYEEKCVEEFGKFAHKVPPTSCDHLKIVACN